MSALRQARVNPLLTPTPKKTTVSQPELTSSASVEHIPPTRFSSFQTPQVQRVQWHGGVPIETHDVPRIDTETARQSFAQVQPTQSGRQSGKSAAERARHAASAARRSQELVQTFNAHMPERLLSTTLPAHVHMAESSVRVATLPSSIVEVPNRQTQAPTSVTMYSKVETPLSPDGSMQHRVDVEAQHTFQLYDADSSGSLDLSELRRAVAKFEALGIAEGLLQAIDLNGDGMLTCKEWVAHFDQMALTSGREVAIEYLRKLDACVVLQQPLSPAKAIPAKSQTHEDVVDEQSTVSVQAELRDALTANFSRCMDLFRAWDANGSGDISKKEFRKAIRALRVTASAVEIDELFGEFDKDGSGAISSRELSRQLRRGAGEDIQLAAELEPGAMGEIPVMSVNPVALRTNPGDGLKARTGIEPTVENIKAAMVEDKWRTKDIMNLLDRNVDGKVTKAEFLSFLPVLGFDMAGSMALSELFDTFDLNRNGAVEFEELHAQLRQALDPSPQDDGIAQPET